MKKRFMSSLSLLLILQLIVTPVVFAGGSADVDVNLPIDELRGLIQQLEEVGAGVVGQAGVEVRAAIDKMSLELEARIDQLGDLGKEMWAMMINDIRAEINTIMNKLKEYLVIINKMVRDRITQLDKALANRIDQLSDVINDTLTQVDGIIQRTIKQAEESAINVINKGELSVLVVIDTLAQNTIRVIVIILDVILLLIILVLSWKGIIPKKVPQIVITVIILILFAGGSAVLLFNNDVYATWFGKNIEVANANEAKKESDKNYKDFVLSASRGASIKTLREKGVVLLSDLKLSEAVAKNQKDRTLIQDQINKMMVILYPPAKPPKPGDTKIQLGVSSKYYSEQVKVLNSISTELRIDRNKLFRTNTIRNLNTPALRIDRIQ